MKRATPPPPDQAPEIPTPKADTFFDLSFRGALPEMLRQLATRLDHHEVSADQFDWSLTRDHLQFSARIDMKPKG